MKYKQLVKIIIFSFIIFILSSCGKNPEKEAKRWNSNLLKAKETIALYPNFTSALQSEVNNAQSSFDKTKTISDEKEKAKAMSEANKMLSRGSLGKLKTIESMIRDIKGKIPEASSLATDMSDHFGADKAAKNAENVINEVNIILKKEIKDSVALSANLKKVMSDLSSAEDSLDRVIRRAESKRKEKKKLLDKRTQTSTNNLKTSTQNKTTQVQKQVAPKMWTCAYCKSKNKITQTKCPGCGASQR